MIDLSDYYSGGYFLIRADKPDWPQLRTEIFPDKLISMSECICPEQFTVAWGVRSGNIRDAQRFGIPETKLDEYADWCFSTAWHDTLEFPGIFYSPEAARSVVQRFQIDTHGLYLIGAGLHKSEFEYWDQGGETEAGVSHMHVSVVDNSRLSPDQYYGTEYFIDERQPLATGGTPLGFEVASFSYQRFGHSWICSGIYSEMQQLYGIRPGQYGLIETREQAQKVFDWIAEDKQQGHRAEPEPYDYWLLVSYPLTN